LVHDGHLLAVHDEGISSDGDYGEGAAHAIGLLRWVAL
jgi:hypothetical protein